MAPLGMIFPVESTPLLITRLKRNPRQRAPACLPANLRSRLRIFKILVRLSAVWQPDLLIFRYVCRPLLRGAETKRKDTSQDLSDEQYYLGK